MRSSKKMKHFILAVIGTACIIAAGCSSKKPNSPPTISTAMIRQSIISNTDCLVELAKMPLQQRKTYLTAHPEVMQSLKSSPDINQRIEFVKLMSQP